MATYKIAANDGSTLFLTVSGSGTINGRQNVIISADAGTDRQQWVVSALSGDQQIKSSNNTSYMLNANTSTWNCDVYTSNSDTYIRFVPVESNRFRLQLVSNTTKYLTAGASSGSAVSWQAASNGSNQIWKFVEVAAPSYTTEAKMFIAVMAAEVMSCVAAEQKACCSVVMNRVVHTAWSENTVTAVLTNGEFNGYDTKADSNYNRVMQYLNTGATAQLSGFCTKQDVDNLAANVLSVYNKTVGDQALKATFFSKGRPDSKYVGAEVFPVSGATHRFFLHT